MAATWRRDGINGGRPELPAVAQMGQPSGPVYDAFTRAAYIAAHRAATQTNGRILRPADIPRQLARAGIEGVPERTVRDWVTKEPDLPERLISTGLATPESFPLFTRPFLRAGTSGGHAQMGQTSPTLAAETTGGIGSLGKLVFGALLVGAVRELLSPGGSRGTPQPRRRAHGLGRRL